MDRPNYNKENLLVAEVEELVNKRFDGSPRDDRKELLATARRPGKVDLAQLETRLIRWTVGTGIGATSIIIAAIKLL